MDEDVDVADVVAADRQRDEIGVLQGRAVELGRPTGAALRHAAEARREHVLCRRARARPRDPRNARRLANALPGSVACSRRLARRAPLPTRSRRAASSKPARPHPGRVGARRAVAAGAAAQERPDALARGERVAERDVGERCRRRSHGAAAALRRGSRIAPSAISARDGVSHARRMIACCGVSAA